MSITVEGARAAYARTLSDRVTLQRRFGTGAAQVKFNADDVPARLSSYAADEIAGTIQQGDQRAIVDAATLEAKQWPTPPRPGDRVIIGTRDMTVMAVNRNDRKVGETIIAYEMQLRGE